MGNRRVPALELPRGTILTLYEVGFLRFSASIASAIACVLYLAAHATSSPLRSFAWGIDLVEAALLTMLLRAPLRRHESLCDADPPEFVVDELLGMFVCLWITQTRNPAIVLGLFVAFRVIDILKPPPFDILDRRVKGRYGFIVDDVAIGAVLGIAVDLLRLA